VGPLGEGFLADRLKQHTIHDRRLLTRQDPRRSNCSGWTSLRDALCGSRIRRDVLDGGFCQGIVSD
jgi:hypothetical protein